MTNMAGLDVRQTGPEHVDELAELLGPPPEPEPDEDEMDELALLDELAREQEVTTCAHPARNCLADRPRSDHHYDLSHHRRPSTASPDWRASSST